MDSPHQEDAPGINDIAIASIQADKNWIKYTRNTIIISLAIVGIITITLSIIFQNLFLGIIRGLIFLIAGFIAYFNSESIFNYRIQFYPNGKIIVKKGLIRKSVTFNSSIGSIDLVKKGKNWLIGIKKVKVTTKAFPNLEEKINEIKH
jgi:hypothetical protein